MRTERRDDSAKAKRSSTALPCPEKPFQRGDKDRLLEKAERRWTIKKDDGTVAELRLFEKKKKSETFLYIDVANKQNVRQSKNCKETVFRYCQPAGPTISAEDPGAISKSDRFRKTKRPFREARRTKQRNGRDAASPFLGPAQAGPCP
ncbi:unnamed protein product [Bursaphelenchus okinawaensis]|uniref:Uncharacterized protein n=1 Tax=Bursaphelenchus okinawaensis TaxID=465554 RepID=A0A811K6A7_9BILA|nr:unnamed protein product [Bursaphelenchus okinawaensis]CAG9092286.1 unnamed protein product [Bursaphelenchus okinawaensis]